MDGNTKHSSTASDEGLVVRAEWSTGPRTPAWERLWRAILSDLGPEPVAVAAPYPTREGDDG
jgi:hypothetical protein